MAKKFRKSIGLNVGDPPDGISSALWNNIPEERQKQYLNLGTKEREALLKLYQQKTNPTANITSTQTDELYKTLPKVNNYVKQDQTYRNPIPVPIIENAYSTNNDNQSIYNVIGYDKSGLPEAKTVIEPLQEFKDKIIQEQKLQQEKDKNLAIKKFNEIQLQGDPKYDTAFTRKLISAMGNPKIKLGGFRSDLGSYNTLNNTIGLDSNQYSGNYLVTAFDENEQKEIDKNKGDYKPIIKKRFNATLLNELAHSFQYTNDDTLGSAWISKLNKNENGPDLIAYLNSYSQPGSIEYNAHSLYYPQLLNMIKTQKIWNPKIGQNVQVVKKKWSK